MSDHGDDLLTSAISEFHVSERSRTSPLPGTLAIRMTVARRHRNRMAALVVVAVLVVALPIGILVGGSRGEHPRPGPADSASPTASTRSTPAPAAIPSFAPLTAQQLTEAEVDSGFAGPSCAAKVGPKKEERAINDVFVQEALPANLDDDPEYETAALIYCVRANDNFTAVVMGFDIGPAGRIAPLGRVVLVSRITNMRTRPAGGVIVTVTIDWAGGFLDEPDPQEREYAWQDGAFRQVDGPPGFVRPAIDLALRAEGNLRWPPPGGNQATLKVKVENLSFEDAPTVRIEAQMLGLISMVGEVRPLAVAAAGPKAGQSVEVTLTFVVDRAQNPHRLLLILRSYTMDPSFRDNSIEVAVVPS